MTSFVPKKWGFEFWICNNDKYCGKLLFFKKEHFCSFHFHKLKEEHFYVQSGRIKIEFSDDSDDIKDAFVEVLEKGDVFHVPVGRRHRMTALLDTELFEFSTHHEDSDSYRIIPS